MYAEWKTPLQTTSQKLNKIDTISLLEKWGYGAHRATEIKKKNAENLNLVKQKSITRNLMETSESEGKHEQ